MRVSAADWAKWKQILQSRSFYKNLIFVFKKN